jgi:hypothetical protein
LQIHESPPHKFIVHARLGFHRANVDLALKPLFDALVFATLIVGGALSMAAQPVTAHQAPGIIKSGQRHFVSSGCAEIIFTASQKYPFAITRQVSYYV